VTCFFCNPAAGAGLSGCKMATRIGNLEEFELKSVGGANQGVSSKMSLHDTDYFELLAVSGVWLDQEHLVGSLGGTCIVLDLMNPGGSYYS